jgi:F-type H+-transporting ATPase subunit delta
MPLVETPSDALARTYAHGLYDLAMHAGGRERVEETLGELEEIIDLARANPKFAELLTSRAISAAARRGSLERIFRGRVSDLTLNFLLVLNARGRLHCLTGILSAFDSLVQQRLGRVEIDVTTADKLDAESLASLRQRLAQALGREVVIHAYVDPSIIGGIKLRIGDQLVDASLASRLRRLRDVLRNKGFEALRSRIDDIITDA